MIYLAVIIGLGGIVSTLALLLRAAALRSHLANARNERTIAIEQRNAARDATHRLAKETMVLKNELKQLEGDLDACNDPGVVRDRLRRLLRGPTAA